MLISIPSLLTLSLICLTDLSIPETELVLIILPSNLFPHYIISVKFYF